MKLFNRITDQVMLFLWRVLKMACGLIIFSMTVLAQAQTVFPEMKTVDTLVVRNLNGDELCRLSPQTVVQLSGVASDYERVRIQTLLGPCAVINSGFVYLNYLRPLSPKINFSTQFANVSIDGLSLRSAPSVVDNTFACALPKNTQVHLTPNEVKKSIRWVEVSLKNTVPGCPPTGWVAGSYLRPDVNLEALPVVDDQENTEAQAASDCTDCKKNAIQDVAQAAKNIEKFVQPASKLAAQNQKGLPNPFIDFLKQVDSEKKCPKTQNPDYPCNRGLVQMPMQREAGFCGSHHYTPDRPYGSDAYAAPHTACALVALAQEWKKNHCPDDESGCRLAWGDISHVRKPIFNNHKSHTSGECIDIRPFNKGEFKDSGRTYTSPDYDREKTIAFMKLAKKMGGQIMYSDKKVLQDKNLQAQLEIKNGGRSHANHLHVCFPESAATQATCQNLQVDPQICSELQ